MEGRTVHVRRKGQATSSEFTRGMCVLFMYERKCGIAEQGNLLEYNFHVDLFLWLDLEPRPLLGFRLSSIN